jgi:hypothetical protein
VAPITTTGDAGGRAELGRDLGPGVTLVDSVGNGIGEEDMGLVDERDEHVDAKGAVAAAEGRAARAEVLDRTGEGLGAVVVDYGMTGALTPGGSPGPCSGDIGASLGPGGLFCPAGPQPVTVGAGLDYVGVEGHAVDHRSS